MDRQTQFVNIARCEGNILRACAGMVLLKHAMNHLCIDLNKDTMHSEDLVLQFAFAECWIKYNDSMKEYGNL